MKKLLLTVFLLNPIFILYSEAEQPSFTYMEGGYSGLDRTGLEPGHGFILRGSYELSSYLYIDAHYEKIYDPFQLNGSTTNFDLTQEERSFGLGVKFPIGENTVFYLETDYEHYRDVFYISSNIASRLNISEGERSYDERGLSATAGIRTMLTDNTEFYTSYSFNDLGIDRGISSNFDEITFGGRYYLTDTIGIFTEYEYIKPKYNGLGIDNYKLGVSFRF